MAHQSVRLDDVQNSLLSEMIISRLQTKKYTVKVENLSDSLIHYTVKKGVKKTTVQMTRDRHKPLYIELDVDALYIRDLKRSEQVLKKRKVQNAGRGGSNRFFSYYILFTVLAFVLNVIIGGLQSTLLWLSNPQNLLRIVVGFLGVYVIIYFITPSFTKRWDRYLMKFDEEVIEDILSILHSVQEELLGGSKVQKCWNCFEDVRVSNTYCEYCGKEVRV